jgi:phage terminase large subunit-like protein
VEKPEVEDRIALKTLENICPFIVGNPWIPQWPTPQQASFLGLHRTRPVAAGVFEALFGGAAGPGKSSALLMAAAQTAWGYPGSASILFRKTFTDLAEPGALMDRAMEWWLPTSKTGIRWDGTNKIFTFPNGSKVSLAYLKNPQDHLRYQSAEYQLVCFDELTQWETPKQYEYIGLSRVRRLKGSSTPLRLLAASNPGGPGHQWVKERFIGAVDMRTGSRIEASRPFLPARIQDNPHLDQDEYIESLKHLHPTVRAQLLKGDWDAREPGDYFRQEWFGPLLHPKETPLPKNDYIAVRWWDLAASEKADAARTAGVLMARLRLGVRAIVHANAFRATPGKRDAAIVRQAHIDGHHVTVGLEIEGGSGGPAQFETLKDRLEREGFRVAGARPRAEIPTEKEAKLLIRTPVSDSGKEARAAPVASCLERGHQRRAECPESGEPWWGADQGRDFYAQRDGLRLYVGPWTQGYLDEVEGFPDVELKDLVDATSGAWAFLEAHPFGLQQAPDRDEKKKARYDDPDASPEDREDVADLGRDRAGHWTP